jgi:hypothetical protein
VKGGGNKMRFSGEWEEKARLDAELNNLQGKDICLNVYDIRLA